jgi:hypothetical protein
MGPENGASLSKLDAFRENRGRKAMTATARRLPETRLTAVHQTKPFNEADDTSLAANRNGRNQERL